MKRGVSQADSGLDKENAPDREAGGVVSTHARRALSAAADATAGLAHELAGVGRRRAAEAVRTASTATGGAFAAEPCPGRAVGTVFAHVLPEAMVEDAVLELRRAQE